MRTSPQLAPASAVAVGMEQPALADSSLADFVKYFLHLGTFGFGGPIALAGYMQRDLDGGVIGLVVSEGQKYRS
jgi:hypothetical protein